MAESQNFTESSDANNDTEARGGELHSTDVDTHQPDKGGDQLSQISELLRQGLSDKEIDDEMSDDESSGESGEGGERQTVKLDKPPETLDQLAEATGLKVEDLYKLAIPDGAQEGKTHTLGELKDAATKVNGLEVKELELEEQHSQREAKLNRMQSELAELFQAIPEQFRTKELVEKISSNHDAKVMREREKALEEIPSWKDETTRNEEIKGIVEHLQDYGLPPSYLASVSDHRLLKYIRENWKRQQRISKTLAMVNEKFPKSTSSTSNPKGKTKPADTPNNRTNNQVRQISNLLKNGD